MLDYIVGERVCGGGGGEGASWSYEPLGMISLANLYRYKVLG